MLVCGHGGWVSDPKKSGMIGYQWAKSTIHISPGWIKLFRRTTLDSIITPAKAFLFTNIGILNDTTRRLGAGGGGVTTWVMEARRSSGPGKWLTSVSARIVLDG